MPITDLLLLCVAVLLGFSVQTALGFGGGLIALSLAASWMPIQSVVPLIVPVSIVQSSTVLLREHAHVAWRPLLRIIAPAMLVGLAAGVGLASVLGEHDTLLRRIYGGFVIALALPSLLRTLPISAEADPTPQRLVATVAALAAGVVHGMFVTGGPPLAYAAHALRLRKDAFRTTMLLTFLGVNAVMLVIFVAEARLGTQQLTPLGALVTMAVLAVPTGRWLARQLPEASFRRAVYGLLLLVGLSLLR